MSNSNASIKEFLKPQSEVSEIEQIDVVSDTTDGGGDYVAFAHGRVGRRPQMMIAFRRCCGEVQAFPYSMLRHLQSEEPDRGFCLSFGEVRVTIVGRGLSRLFRYICEHRAVEVVEADRVEALGDENCVITDITVVSV